MSVRSSMPILVEIGQRLSKLWQRKQCTQVRGPEHGCYQSLFLVVYGLGTQSQSKYFSSEYCEPLASKSNLAMPV